MRAYRIENAESGIILGTYKGVSKQDALDAMARDAEYIDYAHLQREVEGRLIVTETVRSCTDCSA